MYNINNTKQKENQTNSKKKAKSMHIKDKQHENFVSHFKLHINDSAADKTYLDTTIKIDLTSTRAKDCKLISDPNNNRVAVLFSLRTLVKNICECEECRSFCL